MRFSYHGGHQFLLLLQINFKLRNWVIRFPSNHDRLLFWRNIRPFFCKSSDVRSENWRSGKRKSDNHRLAWPSKTLDISGNETEEMRTFIKFCERHKQSFTNGEGKWSLEDNNRSGRPKQLGNETLRCVMMNLTSRKNRSVFPLFDVNVVYL